MVLRVINGPIIDFFIKFLPISRRDLYFLSTFIMLPVFILLRYIQNKILQSILKFTYQNKTKLSID